MRKTKKILAGAMAAFMMTAAFAGCGSTDTTGTTGGKTTGTTGGAATADSAVAKIEGKSFNIGVCQLVQHVALDAATEGFQDKLTALLGEDNVTFTIQNAQGDSANCATICNQFVADKVDLIMANATPALQAAYTATDSIPILGTSVTHYGTALDIKDWKGYSENNVSGTSDLAPLDEQAKIVSELFPDAKKVGLLYCSAEPNSKFQIDTITPYLKDANYEVKEYTFSDSNDIAAVVTSACDECDVLYIPTDNTAASNTGIIDNIAAPKNIPIICGEEGICEGCGVATLSISYYDLGVKTAEMAYDVLVNGADISKMEIGYAPVTKKYDKARAEALGITIPTDYVAIGEDAATADEAN
ncbi:MAG: ABC transporter substrate-binding protein [Clostridia bacterium]|nr:ABC transporter substrate-binding protein [Clostridia bacterium]